MSTDPTTGLSSGRERVEAAADAGGLPDDPNPVDTRAPHHQSTERGMIGGSADKGPAPVGAMDPPQSAGNTRNLPIKE